jgi:hypothetical protein
MVALVEYGKPTADGARVLAYMHQQIIEAEAGSLATLNALPSMIKHFYANVVKLHAMTEAEWLQSYPDNGNVILRGLIQLDEAKAQAEQDAAEKSRISESLDDVKAALALALARLDELEKADKPAEEPAAEPTPEPEADAAPVESKKARKAKTEPEPETVEAETETEA